MKTIFEQIIAEELPSEKVFENDHLIVIKDIAPQAPFHFLIITKKVIPTIAAMEKEEYFLLGEIAAAAKKVAEEFGFDKTGYRLLVNNGPHAGQTVYHLHFHLLGGEHLGHFGVP